MTNSRPHPALLWGLRLVPALIFLQTLYFKFGGAAESVYIFDTASQFLGLPALSAPMRLGSGVAELVAALLLLWPRGSVFGALIGLGTLAGALFFHLASPLGIEVQGDGGTLFALALVAFAACAALAWLEREKLLRLLPKKA